MALIVPIFIEGFALNVSIETFRDSDLVGDFEDLRQIENTFWDFPPLSHVTEGMYLG